MAGMQGSDGEQGQGAEALGNPDRAAPDDISKDPTGIGPIIEHIRSQYNESEREVIARLRREFIRPLGENIGHTIYIDGVEGSGAEETSGEDAEQEESVSHNPAGHVPKGVADFTKYAEVRKVKARHPWRTRKIGDEDKDDRPPLHSV